MKSLKYALFTLALLATIFLVMAMNAPSIKYNTVVIVDNPAAQSFAVYMDVARMAKWMPNFKSMFSKNSHQVYDNLKKVIEVS